MERWRGKVALVTGASAGIGRAVAQRLLDEGMVVAGCARRSERLEAVDGLVPYTVDLRDEAQILEMFGDLQTRFGGVDVLVNNAGLGHHAPLLHGDTQAWREMLEVNVLALCVCTREAVRQMRAKGTPGQIVHVSSMAGHRVPGGSGVYSATKFAVRSLTEALRRELREAGVPIRVGAVSPGFVETEFAAQYHKSEQAARETYDRYQVLQDRDVAEAVVYLLGQPQHVQIHDVLMRPTEQLS
jgi:17beta-estradiol 17-dehydrogenase / 3beta-hydroxysteroid 3-dehydrogenase